jgi:hypothetical protein
MMIAEIVIIAETPCECNRYSTPIQMRQATMRQAVASDGFGVSLRLEK